MTTLTSGETTVGAQNLGRESLVSWKGSVGGAFELIKNGGLIVLGARMGVELAGQLPPEAWNLLSTYAQHFTGAGRESAEVMVAGGVVVGSALAVPAVEWAVESLAGLRRRKEKKFELDVRGGVSEKSRGVYHMAMAELPKNLSAEEIQKAVPRTIVEYLAARGVEGGLSGDKLDKGVEAVAQAMRVIEGDPALKKELNAKYSMPGREPNPVGQDLTEREKVYLGGRMFQQAALENHVDGERVSDNLKLLGLDGNRTTYLDAVVGAVVGSEPVMKSSPVVKRLAELIRGGEDGGKVYDEAVNGIRGLMGGVGGRGGNG